LIRLGGEKSKLRRRGSLKKGKRGTYLAIISASSECELPAISIISAFVFMTPEFLVLRYMGGNKSDQKEKRLTLT